MLDGLLIYVAEIIQVCVIMVNVSNIREIKSRKSILYYGEISEHRQELIHYSSQGICVRICSCSSIKFLNLFITGTRLKKKSRSPGASRLNIHHKSHIIKHFPIIFPDSLHSLHTWFFSICEKHLDTLLPFVLMFECQRDTLKYHTYSISVICSTIRPHSVSRHRLRIS